MTHKKNETPLQHLETDILHNQTVTNNIDTILLEELTPNMLGYGACFEMGPIVCLHIYV